MLDKKHQLQTNSFKEYKNESRNKQKEILENVADYND